MSERGDSKKIIRPDASVWGKRDEGAVDNTPESREALRQTIESLTAQLESGDQKYDRAAAERLLESLKKKYQEWTKK